jgi:hypothetical protein
LHRDLKPSNVMIDERGSVRLLDFGLAKAIDPDLRMGVDLTLSEPGQLVGTLAYMSPEQSRGQFEQMSVRSDVYSLGAMTFELLTGQLPCDVDGPLAEVLTRIARQDPKRPSLLRRELDADVDAILLKALEKSPERRYVTAAELADDLRRYLAHEPIVARRAGPVARLARWARRNRAVASVSAVGALLIVVIAAMSFLQIVAERDNALAWGRQADEMANLTLEMQVYGSPERSGGIDPDTCERFDDWERQLETHQFKPSMEAQFRARLGRLMWAAGQHERAQSTSHRICTSFRATTRRSATIARLWRSANGSPIRSRPRSRAASPAWRGC